MTEQRLSVEQCQALELLASRPDGVTERLLVLAHGFDTDIIAGLVHTGLATADRETVKTLAKTRVKTIEVVRVRITAAGRRALEE
jgi:hypothetical protein